MPKLIEIFRIMRQGIHARGAAWMHVMTTFTNLTYKFKNECIYKNASLFTAELQKTVLSSMVKRINPYDIYYCIETYKLFVNVKTFTN